MDLGRLLIILGVVLIIAGAIVIVVTRLNIPLGRLPGDISWRGRNTTFYFPWMTCLVLSVLLSLILWLFNRR